MLAARENVPVLPSRSLFNEPISDGANSKTIVSRKKNNFRALRVSRSRDPTIQRHTPFLHRNRPRNRLELATPYNFIPFYVSREMLKERFVSFFLTLFNFWEIFPFSENVEIWRDDILSRKINSCSKEYDTFLVRSTEKSDTFVTMTRIRRILSQNGQLENRNGDERNRLLKTDDRRANVGGNGRVG